MTWPESHRSADSANRITSARYACLDPPTRRTHITDTDAEIVHTEACESDLDYSVADISNGEQDLDFSSSVSLQEGLERTIEWWQSDRMTTNRPQRQGQPSLMRALGSLAGYA